MRLKLLKLKDVKQKYILFITLIAFGMAGCAGVEPTYDEEDTLSRQEQRTHKMGKLFGPLTFGAERDTPSAGSVGIGVNRYLWQASLDVISFMPLQSADPFGGVVITDWYVPPHTADERLKVTILILDRHLRADGVKVSVFRQKIVKGHWIDQIVRPETARKLEENILTRARQMRIQGGK